MCTFKLVLRELGGVYKPVVFRIKKPGPLYFLCVQGNFNTKEPVSFFGLQVVPSWNVIVFLDPVFAVSLVCRARFRSAVINDLGFYFNGQYYPPVFCSYLIQNFPN